jgi:hypothetical protein
MKIEDIKNAYVSGKPVHPRYAGEAIAKDREMFFAFLIDNQPEIINRTLRVKLGHGNLPFAADRRAIGATVNLMIKKGDNTTLQTIINAFVEAGFNPNANNYTSDPELAKEILKHLQ